MELSSEVSANTMLTVVLKYRRPVIISKRSATTVCTDCMETAAKLTPFVDITRLRSDKELKLIIQFQFRTETEYSVSVLN